MTAIIAASVLHQAFIEAKPYLTCSVEIVAQYLLESASWLEGKSLEWIISDLADYVGSHGAYEEGCEEEW